MISFEDELAEALVQTGAEVTSVPPLHLPQLRFPAPSVPAEYQTPERGRKARWQVRWLAPAGAAAAVAAIVCAISVTAASVPAVRPHATASVGGRGFAAASAVPRYYIALTGTRRPYAVHSHGAGIYSTAAGTLLAKVTLPPEHWVMSVTAASDDRTFGVTGLYWHSSGHGLRSQRLAFYLLRFNGSRLRVVQVVKNLPGLDLAARVTLSPDGTKIAYSWGVPLAQAEYAIAVIDLRSGKTHTWSGFGEPFGPGLLSWGSDNRTLAYNWGSTSPGLRLLDTGASGQSLGKDSRIAVPVTFFERTHEPQMSVPGGMVTGNFFLTPGGTTAVSAVTNLTGDRSGFGLFSTRTGRRITTFDTGPTSSSDVLWSDPDGRTLIVWSPPGHPGRLAIVRPGKLTLLPASARAVLPFAAW
ncbi:MAG TPA: hypothetical protein VFQ44_15735 [Streptosporangiaceae bacterium]|nr:hypothetical protein [Streptosporangiaceae bacterium]